VNSYVATRPEPSLDGLDMGIHANDGVVWLPKAFAATRNAAKQWALTHGFIDSYIDARVRTVFMAEDDEHDESGWYVKCLPEAEGAIECWEIR
jgi:hypothetical protein